MDYLLFYHSRQRHYRLGNISPDEYEHRLKNISEKVSGLS
ncbi:hypothetical protein SSYM_0466 [Serratia symbiotica str. Tucson]|uniref:Uncharacterized protein n=1 Tax=Serratia symbiotica str. Tucson TaxID=914128 RepID=E9CKB8_9GAMM|nr:hypothetical protein SSYM_0466 [Serratia symbiotica str. Tucson]